MEDFSGRYDVKGDAARVFDCLMGGGVAVVHYDLSYAVLSHTDEALKRVYRAKNRSYDRASGVVGSYTIHDEVHILDEEKRRMVRAITADHDLPLSVIAPFRENHPFMKALTPFLLGMATRDGTVNFLMNAGQLRDEIAKLSWSECKPLVGSSANVSLQGTKYRLEDVEKPVLDAADITVSYGMSKFAHPKSISSTQIDFRTMKVVRWGICFDQISEILREEFGVRLEERPAHLHA